MSAVTRPILPMTSYDTLLLSERWLGNACPCNASPVQGRMAFAARGGAMNRSASAVTMGRTAADGPGFG